MLVTFNKRIFIIIAIIIGLVAFLFSLVSNLYHPLPEETLLEMKIRVLDKDNLKNLYTTHNFTIVDCSPTNTDYLAGHRLPGAVWSKDPALLYNTRRPVVVYSDNDTVSRGFCIELLRHVTFSVYMFPGGYEVWSKGG